MRLKTKDKASFVLEEARDHLLPFCILMNKDFACPSHIKLIAQHLEKVERGELKRLIINMPPRHGKSMLTSEMFPAWFMGRNPHKNIMFSTYNQSFANDFGRKVRNKLQEDLFNAIFPYTQVAGDSSANNRFHTSKGGAYFAIGRDASLTGRGAHLLIIDDPIKNQEEADSSLIRQNLKDWFSTAAYTRLEPNGAIIIIQTRWHTDDLTGWVLDQENKEDWTVLSLPAVDENNLALWPDRFSLEAFDDIRATIPTRHWSSLYMQKPIMDADAPFKGEWIQYYQTLDPTTLNNYIIVDPANSKTNSGDYTAIIVLGQGADGNIYLVDAYRDKLSLTEREDILFELHAKYDPKMTYYEKYGMQLDCEFMRRAMEFRNYRFPIQELGGNSLTKEDRIKRIVPLFEARKIWFPKSIRRKNWQGRTECVIDKFIHEEYLQFPVAKHDDMLDALGRIPDIKMTKPNQSRINYYELYGR